MLNHLPFNKFTSEYDNWFENNREIFNAEIKAIKNFIPSNGVGLEVGIGTARFAAPLGISFGIDPSLNMLKIAKKRKVLVCLAYGEQLPFGNSQFDYLLLVTVICFAGNIIKLLDESKRVIKPNGKIIVAFIDRESNLGKLYESKKAQDKFYSSANFFSTKDVINLLQELKFKNLRFRQTILGLPHNKDFSLKTLDGFGKGAFVVIEAHK